MNSKKEFLGYPAWHWWLSIAGVVVFLLILSLLSNGDSAAQSSGGGQQTDSSEKYLVAEACLAAQDAVRAKLKSPSTAKFPGCVLGAHEYRIGIDAENRNIMVMGHVDAQNSFGATLRSRFGVRMERNEGQLTVVRVELFDFDL